MNHLKRGIWAVLLVASIVDFSGTAYTQKRAPDIHFESTPQEVVEEMLEMAKVTKDDIVYDLGCGDGRFVITAAKKYGARSVGGDIDPKRVKETRENALAGGVADRVKIIEDDLFTTDISEATVITLYLLTEMNLKLRPKLFRELKPGTRIVSYVFDMDDWQPDEKGENSFYYWVLPANVAGVWRWNIPKQKGGQRFGVSLKQNFQEITGHVNFQEGRQVRITDAKLTGEYLNFKVRYKEANKQEVLMLFTGKGSRNVIHGSIEVTGRPLAGAHTWTANRNP